MTTTLEQLDKAECLRLITPGGIGRIAYAGRYGLTVFPVNYRLHEGAIVFRTAQDSPTGEDLQTGIAQAEYWVAFEIDDIDLAAREGWSVLIQGPAHHMTTEAERASVLESGVEPWPGGPREHAIRITPTRITGRRLRQSPPPAGRRSTGQEDGGGAEVTWRTGAGQATPTRRPPLSGRSGCA